MGLSAYEEQRNRNIAENLARLQSLGLESIVEKSRAPANRAPKVVQPKKRALAPQRTERKLRTRTEPAERYQPMDEERPKRRAAPRPLELPFDPALDALPEALEEAEEEGDSTPQPGGFTFVKHMLASHVTGGYWLQAPFELTQVMPKAVSGTKYDIQLRVGGSKWGVVWLGRDSGAGLSGGWRGFAVDQRLCVGDAVALQQRSGESRTILDVHIFRAHLLGGEHEALDAAFDLADALNGAAEPAAAPAPLPSPATRPALHWHSLRAQTMRPQLPEAVRAAATVRVSCATEQCVRLARHALEGGALEAGALGQSDAPPPSPATVAPLQEGAGGDGAGEAEGEAGGEAGGGEGEGEAAAAAAAAAAEADDADADDEYDDDADTDATDDAMPPAAEAPPLRSASLAVGALLWGAPQARGAPLARGRVARAAAPAAPRRTRRRPGRHRLAARGVRGRARVLRTRRGGPASARAGARLRLLPAHSAADQAGRQLQLAHVPRRQDLRGAARRAKRGARAVRDAARAQRVPPTLSASLPLSQWALQRSRLGMRLRGPRPCPRPTRPPVGRRRCAAPRA